MQHKLSKLNSKQPVHRFGTIIFAGTFLFALGVSLVAASIFTPVDNTSAADSSSASTSVNLSIDQVLALSTSVDNVTFNITPDKFDNMLTSDFNVLVETNNPTGYTLTMSTTALDKAGSSTNALVHTTNNNLTIPSISSDFDLSDNNPAGNTPSSFPLNTWAYAMDTTNTNNVYKPLPTSTGTILKNPTALEDNTDGTIVSTETTNISLATKANATTPAGQFTNTLLFTVVTNYNAEYDNYTITYDRNGTAGDDTNGTIGGDMSMVSHTNVKEGDSIMLYAPNYWRTGYGFVGWSFDKDATPGGSSTIYGPNESIAAPSNTSSNGMTLYAVWKASEGNMQSWQGCSSMSIGNITALTDTRDNNTYTVAKLKDNKCWSTENLRLSSGTIDSTTTNNPIDGFAWTASTNSWCTTNSSDCHNQVLVNTNNINPSLTASPNANNNSSSWYGYGTYYNWHAATAGNGTYEKSSGNVTGDICPLGWHLPTSASSGEFQAIYNAVGSTSSSLRIYPNSFVLSGTWTGSRAYLRRSGTRYWSSTARDKNNAYDLLLSSGSANPLDHYSKSDGRPVRCVSNTATIDGVGYIRLADGNWWTKNRQNDDAVLWENAAALCPTGTALPTAEQASNLVTAYGGVAYEDYGTPYGRQHIGVDLYNAARSWTAGSNTSFFTSTVYESDSNKIWVFGVYPTYSAVTNRGTRTYPLHVVCVRS